jgi:ATP-dependent protease ClpP protease subunit
MTVINKSTRPIPKASFGKRAVVALDRAGNQVENISPAMNLAGGTVNIMIFGEISEWWGVNKSDVYWALKDRQVSQINVFISSPGGEVDEAFVIHDMLAGHPANVTAYLVGQCASAATIISCSANEVLMSAQCLFMIHKPTWFQWGDAESLRKGADILDKYQSLIIGVYKRKTGMPDDRLNELMNAETWFEPSEALALGFVDQIVDNIEVDFLLPTTGVNNPNEEMDGIFDSARSYTDAATLALEHNLRPANKADISKFVNKRKNKAMNEFFKGILNFLNGKGALAPNTNVDTLADDMAANEALNTAAENETVNNAVKKAVANLQPTAITMEGVLNMVEKASDEDKAKLAKALNLEPVADKASDEETDEGGGSITEDVVMTLTTKVNDLIAEIANLKKPGSVSSPTNGGKPTGDKPTGKEAKISDHKKKIALDSFRAGKINAEMYTKITGEEPPVRERK